MEFVYLILALALLIWGGAFLKFGGIWAGCLAVLSLGTVLGHSFFHAGPITLDRVLLAVLVVMHLLARRLQISPPRNLHREDLLPMVLLGVLAVSTFTHDWRIRQAQPVSSMVFYYVLPMVLGFLATQITLTPGRIRGMLIVLGAMSGYLAVTAIAEVNGMGWAVFPKYIVDSKFPEFLGRGRGPLLNPVGNGMLMTLGACAMAVLFFHARGWARIPILGGLLLNALGLYCTLTRSVWIGAALAGVIVAGAYLPRRARLPALAAILVGGVIFLAVKWDSMSSFKRDKFVNAQEMAESAQLRPILAAVAWNIFKDHPLFGCGYGQYSEVNVDYLWDRDIDLPLHKAKAYVQHNVFLAALAETGFVGLAAITSLFSLWTISAWRLSRSPSHDRLASGAGLILLGWMGAYFVNGMFHDLAIIPMIHMFAFFLAGVCRNLQPVSSPLRPLRLTFLTSMPTAARV